MTTTVDMFKQLRAELLRDEGCRLAPYTDTRGHLTIGIGHRLDRGISQAAAEFILTDDIMQVFDGLDALLPRWRLESAVRQRALANMAFNLGVHGLMRFKKFLAALDAGEYEIAAKEMLRSKWAKQVGARATRLSEMIRNG